MASSGNFCTWNPRLAQGGGTPDLTRSGTLTQGNLNYNPGSYGIIMGSVGVTTGKWYWELRATGANASGPVVGWLNERHNSGGSFGSSPGYNSPASATQAQVIYIYLVPSSGNIDIVSDGPKSSSSGTDTDAPGISANDIIGLAADFDNDKWYFSINGSFTDVRSGQNPATGSNPLCSASGGGGLETISRTTGLTWYPTYGNWSGSSKAAYANFGQDSTFGGGVSAGGNADENGFGDFKYSVPTGFLSMCSANLPLSSDIDPAQTDDDFAGGKLFNVVTYTGNGSDGHAITGVGFQPDFVWLKKTSGSASHQLYDSSRGTGKLISSNNTDAEATYSTVLQSFDSDGFTLGTSAAINGSSATMVAWCWKVNGGTTSSNTSGDINSTVQVNDKAGMSIVQYTGNGSQNQTIGHGLTKAPEMVWMKNLSNSNVGGIDMDWIVALSTSTGSPFSYLNNSSQTLELNENKVLSGKYRTEGNFTPTTSTFNVPNNGNAPYWFNANANNYIAYCWHSVEGFSKFGMYVANGNTDGPFIYTGFKPRLIFCKTTGQADSWIVHDTERNTMNPSDKIVYWDTNEAQASGSSYYIDVLANGFKVRSTNSLLNNTSADPYIYGAWGDVPFKYNNTFG